MSKIEPLYRDQSRQVSTEKRFTALEHRIMMPTSRMTMAAEAPGANRAYSPSSTQTAPTARGIHHRLSPQARRAMAAWMLLRPVTSRNTQTMVPTSATSVLAARQACKNILYTVVNSRAYEAENLNPGMPTWQKIGIGIDVVLGLALVALEVKAIQNYKRRTSGEAVTVSEEKSAE